MATGRLTLRLVPAESLTVSVAVLAPSAVGVPEMIPSGETARPPGKPLAAQLYGAVPPVATRTCLYCRPTTPSLKAAVVIAREDRGIRYPTTSAPTWTGLDDPFVSVTVPVADNGLTSRPDTD
jgi:hypothetical protein